VSAPVLSSRRDRLRLETTAEIKQRSWQLLGEVGAAGLSLRAVARSMGMAPSALYRYFPSRDDLLTALIVDGFDSLADALVLAYDGARDAPRDGSGGQVPANDAVPTFRTVARAYRQWALDNPAAFGLVFSSPVPGYDGNDQTTAAALRSSAVLLGVMADLVHQGSLDLQSVDPRVPAGLRDRLQQWRQHGGPELPPAALAAAMWCYASLHGMVTLELNHHFPPALQDDVELFESCVDSVVRSFVLPAALPAPERPSPT
jgi:AcrR family transcriptional regulator